MHVNRYDYGARFYDPTIGRWHSKEPYAELVPGISPYAYCYNDPINFSEPTGKWPGWVHRHIIRKALNPYIGHGLTEDQLNRIIEGGAYIDNYYQDPKFSYMHSMRNGVKSQSFEEAKNARDQWVSDNIKEFKAHGDRDYEKLGYAIHAMSDEPAPTHSWKPWSGLSLSNGYGLPHFLGELNLLGSRSERFKLSVDLVVKTYKDATPESVLDPAPAPRPDAPDPMTPIPWQPLPVPIPNPVPIYPPQPPLPIPQPRG